MGRAFLTLPQFLRRQAVLGQYRAFLRTARRLPEDQREEILGWVRHDFRRHAAIPAAEEDRVKSLLQQGERMLKELRQNVELATASEASEAPRA